MSPEAPALLAGTRPQRATGRLELGFAYADGRTRLQTLYQEGCLKARLPRPADPWIPEAVTLNISGGIAGGDVLHSAITIGSQARAIVAGQAAERLYRAQDALPASITTHLTVGENASLIWLPQETILFDGFSLVRRLTIDLGAHAAFLGVESLVFGRQARGERLNTGSLTDKVTLSIGGRLVLADHTSLSGDIAGILGRPAIAAGATAMASLIHAGPDAAAGLHGLRAILAAHDDCTAGASIVDGVLVARILAPSSLCLRQCLTACVAFCTGRALPRVWQS